MRWLKSYRWKAGIAIAGVLLLLVLLVWVPVSAAGAYEGTPGLATPGTGTVQTTPTVDATVAALNKEKLAQEIQQLKNQNDRSISAWFWNSGGLLGTVTAALLAVAGVLATVVFNFRQWTERQQMEHEKELKDRQEAQDKDLKDKAEERFKTAVTALGDEKEGVQVGGAILLRSFLNEDDKKSYERYYTQIFDLAVAYLRLPRTPPSSEDPDGIPHSPEDPNTPLPLTALRLALIVVFKEAFPLARSQNKGDPQSLDATGIQLDNAYLSEADLNQVWMPKALLRNVNLRVANLIGADLHRAYLHRAYLHRAILRGADLHRANLHRADLSRAILMGANLSGADLSIADLSGANLSEANLSGADLSSTKLEDAILQDTDLRGVKGLTKEQLETLKAKGAIIDDETTTSPPQSPVSPPALSQSNGAPASSAPPAQVSNPTPGTDGSSTTSSQQSPDAQTPSAPPAQVNTPPPDAGGSSAPSSQQGHGS